MEKEWERAAGGEPDGSVRQYPWAAYKGEPNPNLANYDKNVGATTPVGRYPEGATPLGLMDVAGNAWEWMENYYDYDKNWYSLRGGSWYDDGPNLRCSVRSSGGPNLDYDVIGFRVLRTQ
jgi:formylglycine-generating enzyme required for sulfatase activity